MERLTLQVGSFEVNCSILSAGGKAWLVDPGQEADRLLAQLKDRRLTPTGILLTHAHFDHIGAVAGLQQAFPDLPVYVHPLDVPVITHPFNQYPPDYPPVPMPKNVVGRLDAWTLEGGEKVEVIETPGHTPGGVSFYVPPSASHDGPPLLLSGDTLFAGSVGRTDLPGGDMATLVASLKKLAALPHDTVVVPGHGPETTIGAERRANPFLR